MKFVYQISICKQTSQETQNFQYIYKKHQQYSMCIIGYGWRRGNRSKDVFAPPPVVSDTACSGPWPVRPRGRTSGERQHCSDPPATAAASIICCSENSVPHTYHSSWTVHPVLLRRPWFLAPHQSAWHWPCMAYLTTSPMEWQFALCRNVCSHSRPRCG